MRTVFGLVPLLCVLGAILAVPGAGRADSAPDSKKLEREWRAERGRLVRDIRSLERKGGDAAKLNELRERLATLNRFFDRATKPPRPAAALDPKKNVARALAALKAQRARIQRWIGRAAARLKQRASEKRLADTALAKHRKRKRPKRTPPGRPKGYESGQLAGKAMALRARALAREAQLRELRARLVVLNRRIAKATSSPKAFFHTLKPAPLAKKPPAPRRSKEKGDRR
jgi:hypothetical protein